MALYKITSQAEDSVEILVNLTYQEYMLINRIFDMLSDHAPDYAPVNTIELINEGEDNE